MDNRGTRLPGRYARPLQPDRNCKPDRPAGAGVEAEGLPSY
jgi:hypothetical protein